MPRKATWFSSRPLSIVTFSDTGDTGPSTIIPSIFPKEREVAQSKMELLRHARPTVVSEVPSARQAAEEGKASWQEGDLGTAQQSLRGF